MATLLSRLRPCISVRLIASRVFSSPSFKPHNSLSSSFSRPFLNPRAFVGYPIKDKDAYADADAGGGGVSRASIKDADVGGGGVSRVPIKDADAGGGGVSRAPIKVSDTWRTFTRLRGLLGEMEKKRGLSVSDDIADDTKTELYEVYMGERQPDNYDTDEIASHIDLLAPLLGSMEAARESIKCSYGCKISGFGVMLTALQAKRLAEFPNVVSVDRCRGLLCGRRLC
ncbi:hypothetical protein CKAN_00770000 [Cinnamomum micranthum f. kanehirae]|uniref:Inhibitor I9 domain-containing protein n=1 Tax=Cinnamomum micranthum f. kanehirae TaxID=337451 RepID=A0A3S3M8T7_9MAGN|nr:hypothetical protein CKAN_00770000 [Cinnamomum micranthum f. kanehirae]